MKGTMATSGPATIVIILILLNGTFAISPVNSNGGGKNTIPFTLQGGRSTNRNTIPFTLQGGRSTIPLNQLGGRTSSPLTPQRVINTDPSAQQEQQQEQQKQRQREEERKKQQQQQQQQQEQQKQRQREEERKKQQQQLQQQQQRKEERQQEEQRQQEQQAKRIKTAPITPNNKGGTNFNNNKPQQIVVRNPSRLFQSSNHLTTFPLTPQQIIVADPSRLFQSSNHLTTFPLPPQQPLSSPVQGNQAKKMRQGTLSGFIKVTPSSKQSVDQPIKNEATVAERADVDKSGDSKKASLVKNVYVESSKHQALGKGMRTAIEVKVDRKSTFEAEEQPLVMVRNEGHPVTTQGDEGQRSRMETIPEKEETDMEGGNERNVVDPSELVFPELYPQPTEEEEKMMTVRNKNLRKLGMFRPGTTYDKTKPRRFEKVLGKYVQLGNEILLSHHNNLWAKVEDFSIESPLYSVPGYIGNRALTIFLGRLKRAIVAMSIPEIGVWTERCKLDVKKAELRDEEWLGRSFSTTPGNFETKELHYIPALKRVVAIGEEVIISIARGKTAFFTEFTRQQSYNFKIRTLTEESKSPVKSLAAITRDKNSVSESEILWWRTRNEPVTEDRGGTTFYFDPLLETDDKYARIGQEVVFKGAKVVCKGTGGLNPLTIMWKYNSYDRISLASVSRAMEFNKNLKEKKFMKNHGRERRPLLVDSDGYYEEEDARVGKVKFQDVIWVKFRTSDDPLKLVVKGLTITQEKLTYTMEINGKDETGTLPYLEMALLPRNHRYWTGLRPIENFDENVWGIQGFEPLAIQRISRGIIRNMWGEKDEAGDVYVYEEFTPTSTTPLIKIGETRKGVRVRVAQTTKTNNERYRILAAFKTSHRFFVESCTHMELVGRGLWSPRDVKDGGSEWFSATKEAAIEIINKCKGVIEGFQGLLGTDF